SLLPLLRPPRATLFPYTTLFRSMTSDTGWHGLETWLVTLPAGLPAVICLDPHQYELHLLEAPAVADDELADALRFRMRDLLPPKDRKSTRLNSSHVKISYAVFCL